jgi:Zn-dependent M16 (insulinase) family peptidase
VREQNLPQIRAVAREFEHLPSGARLLHLACDDPENCFALIFPTPPDADTGVPHILEHAVLAGSEKYPVREPFFELIKSSPAGFINAMTSDIWTVYPICTTLEGDFWNLAEVYTDAVFHPQLTRDTFEREGHHLELERPGDLESPLIRSGIVYNEMKGAYSNTEMVIHWRLKKELFPGSTLGFDSGGDPKDIPRLTFEGLREFYGRFYAPGNCLVFLYGDISTEKHLAYWGEKLSGRGKAPSLAQRPEVAAWNAPRQLEETYPVEPDSDLTQRTYLSLRWRCGDGLDPFEEIAWTVLSRLLSGHDGAPLKKALIDSKLGADVLACAAETVQSERTFHVGLKGSEPERAEEFEAFVLKGTARDCRCRFHERRS